MSDQISIVSKPRRCEGLRWRTDGEDGQIIILHKREFPLPKILNPVAAEIFFLCDGERTVEDIIVAINERFDVEDLGRVSEEVKECIRFFLQSGIVEV